MAQSRTRITIETETMTTLRQARLEPGWCPECLAEVQVITLGEDVTPDSEASRRLERWRATRELHDWVNPSGLLQMCLRSLMRCMDVDEGLASEFKEAK